MLLGDRNKFTRKRALGRSTKAPQHGGSRAVFRGLVNTAVTCRGCSKDLKDPPRASPTAFEAWSFLF